MASSFDTFHDLENRIDHIELKNNPLKDKPQRAVLGVLHQNVSKPLLTRKAKNEANNKLGLKVQDENKCGSSNFHQQSSNFQQSQFVKKDKKTHSYQFTIHQDDSSEVPEHRLKGDTKKHSERQKNHDAHNGNEENEALDHISMLPKAFCKTKIWQDEEEPMSLDKSILSPMSVDMSTDKITPIKKKNPEDAVCIIINMDQYRDDIFQYLLQCERRIRPKPCYMQKQPDINSEMRSVLVDWLIEVAEEYKMHNETLHLAVNYVDRFLSLMSVVRSKLQLVGTTALFVASKYEEIYPPEISEFVYITDDTYTKKQVLKMEQLMLKVLDFDLNIPTIHTFICHVVVSAQLGPSVLYMAQYFSELILVSGDPFLQYVPSLVASACIALARHCLDYEKIWPETLTLITEYTLNELTDCIKRLEDILIKTEKSVQQAAYNKYKVNLWSNVSTLEFKPFTS